MAIQNVVRGTARVGNIMTQGRTLKGLMTFEGARAVGVLRVASNVADAQTVTIGSEVYEFDRAADGVVAGRYAVTGHDDDMPTEATDALVTAINAHSQIVTAVLVSANEVLVYTKTAAALTYTLAETLTGTNNAWDTNAMRKGAAPAVRKTAWLTRVPNAQEVVLGNLHIPLDFNPSFVTVSVRATSTGITTAWNGGITVTNNLITLTNVGDADWAATDTVSVFAAE